MPTRIKSVRSWHVLKRIWGSETMQGAKVYILMKEYQSSFGCKFEPEVVDVYVDKKEAVNIASEKNKGNNRKYEYTVKSKVLK